MKLSFISLSLRQNSTMMNQDGLSTLRDFTYEFLSSTENVKKILEAECEEARYVLRPWPIETIITKEIDENCCTCESKSTLEDHVEEIVEGIGKALAQAQELREKIAINVSKQKRKLREPSLQTIYMPASVQQKTKVSTKKDQISKPQNIPKSVEIPKESSKQERKTTGKNITDKKLLKTSSRNTMASKTASKSAKNFVAANKSNIKNCKRFSKSTIDLTAQVKKSSDCLSPLSGTSQTLSGCSTSIAELNNLMDRVSVGEKKSASSTSCFQSDDCPCHGKNAQQFVQEKIRTTVDMIEGLDRYGVPGEVVRILKMHHSYLNQELADEGTDKKGKRAADRFLVAFDKMNEDRSSKCKTASLENLTINFASLFREAHSSHFSSTEEKNSINLRYSELDSQSKSFHLKKFDPAEFRKPKASLNLKKDFSNVRSWSSNGVWNPVVIPDSFADINRAQCIRYANKSQLLSFFEDNQRLQQLLYHRDLLELLLTSFIPNVLKSFDPSSKEYCEIYKMIFTIAQVLNPRIAVLVRTDV